MVRIKTIGSLEKVFFDFPEGAREQKSGSMLKNEIYSFQLAAMICGEVGQRNICKIEIDSEISDCISVFFVDYVPVLLPCYENADDNYISKNPGIFPDPLRKVENGEINLAKNQARAFWITIEPNGKYIGKHSININILSKENDAMASASFEIDIIDAKLDDLKIYNTCWFHGDCIAKQHNVPMYGIKYRVLLQKYLEAYVKAGHNMILTPVFTPPLDTARGGERMTNQLVGVTIEKGKYKFNFERFYEWIFTCREAGIKYFEISHLFTQWGAENAPKIMATVNGKEKRIFGWETNSLSDKYKRFINAFLTEFIRVLKELKIYNRCFFHVSDEPSIKHLKRYKEAREILLSYISESKIIDALSDYEFYKTGAIKTPIVPNDKIDVFLKNGTKNLWTYYCCEQGSEVSNRFIAMPSARNRILGLQLYKNNISGFLQWGFNFWFSQFSTKQINPYCDTQADGGFPAGDAFIVYPIENEEVVCSLRLFVFREAMQDYRALCLLEKLAGREEVLALLGDISGFKTYPKSGEYILSLREKINRRIASLR